VRCRPQRLLSKVFFSTAASLFLSPPQNQATVIISLDFSALSFFWVSESLRLSTIFCHLAVIMNSLVATPPVPPHFYENRFSPSRMSKTSLFTILSSGLMEQKIFFGAYKY
jgi:hypothetical protein